MGHLTAWEEDYKGNNTSPSLQSPLANSWSPSCTVLQRESCAQNFRPTCRVTFQEGLTQTHEPPTPMSERTYICEDDCLVGCCAVLYGAANGPTFRRFLTAFIALITGSTALRGPWPSSEASASWSIRLLLLHISWQESFPGWGQFHAQPPAVLEGRCFLSGLSPLAD
jgi:hypothetical protein